MSHELSHKLIRYLIAGRDCVSGLDVRGCVMTPEYCKVCEGAGCVSVRVPRGYPFEASGRQRWISAALKCRCEAGDQFARSMNPASLVSYMTTWAHRWHESHRAFIDQLSEGVTKHTHQSEFDRMCYLLWRYPEGNTPRLTIRGVERLPLYHPRKVSVRS